MLFVQGERKAAIAASATGIAMIRGILRLAVAEPTVPDRRHRGVMARRKGEMSGRLAALLTELTEPRAESPATAERDYAALKRRILDAGLMRKRPEYYFLSITTNLVLFVGCLVLLFSVKAVWMQALVAVGLGIVSGQLGFQLHDSGHRQMFVSAGKNALVGLITADLLLGMSYGWWVHKHNLHHGNPNDVDLDPDIKVGAIAYSWDQAVARGRFGRLVAMYQAYLFFPLTTLLAWSMHVTGLTYLIKGQSRYRRVEFVLLAAHAVVYLGAMIHFLGPWSALLVVLIHKGVGGMYLASVFAPNHKGMPQTDGTTRWDFVRTQVLTARNIRSHPITDLWYGSLNYQIEHHLFPNMPRLNMRRAQPIVRQFCEERGISYHETSFIDSYRELLGFLNEIGAPLREARAQA
jgi:fatty acid desaturase